MADIDVLLLCALKDEYDQEITVTDGITKDGWKKSVDNSGRIISEAEFSSKNSLIKIRSTWLTRMGREHAQAVASAIFNETPFKCIAMSGICAGRRGETELGDVIFADFVWSYDAGKRVNENNQSTLIGDITPYSPSDELIQRMQNLDPYPDAEWINLRPELSYERQEIWVLQCLLKNTDPTKHEEFSKKCPNWDHVLKRLWKKEWLINKSTTLTHLGKEKIEEFSLLNPFVAPEQKKFKVHIGPMATGGYVQEDGEIFTQLSKSKRKVLGIDMEASGIGAQAKSIGVPFIIAKGVSDYADTFKDDQYRIFSAKASAEILINFIRKNSDLIKLNNISLNGIVKIYSTIFIILGLILIIPFVYSLISKLSCFLLGSYCLTAGIGSALKKKWAHNLFITNLSIILLAILFFTLYFIFHAPQPNESIFSTPDALKLEYMED